MKMLARRISVILLLFVFLQNVLVSYGSPVSNVLSLLGTAGSDYLTDAPEEYITFQSDRTFSMSTNQRNWPGTGKIIYYSPQHTTETKWDEWNGSGSISASLAGDGKTYELKICGVNNTFITGTDSPDSAWNFAAESDQMISCKGNIMTLLDYLSVEQDIDISMDSLAFACLFSGCGNLESSPELPSEALSMGCYYQMFSGCSKLRSCPVLPAETLTSGCYAGMFSGCSSLTHAMADLPAQTAADYCYQNMFSDCTSLRKAPDIKAESLEAYSCSSMFYGCTSLTNIPGFSASHYGYSCCSCMFYDCSSLNIATSSTAAKPVLRFANAGTSPGTDPADDWNTGLLCGTQNPYFTTSDPVFDTNYYVLSAENEIVWDPDGGLIDDSSETISTYVPYGEAPSGTAIPEDPEKQDTLSETFTFTGWADKNGSVFTGDFPALFADTVYTAKYESTPRLYTLDFSSSDPDYGSITEGGAEITSLDVPYGSKLSVSGDTLTVKNAAETSTLHTVKAVPASKTSQYSYAFKADSWKLGGTSFTAHTVTEDASVSAGFTQTLNTYTVTWQNEDKTILETDTGVSYGSTPSYDSSVPAKASTAEYSYSFDQWTPSVSPVTGDVTYTATYRSTKQQYTVTWLKADGNALKTESLPYGTVPSYTGSAPVKASTAEFDYTFTGWSPEPSAITGNTVYNPVFRAAKRSYTVTWTDDEGKVLKTETLPYGSTPSYGTNVPEKPETSMNTYEFSAWVPAVRAVDSNITYQAVFTRTTRSYLVTFNENGHGTAPEALTVKVGDKVSKPADPSASSYTFGGWYKEAACTNSWNFETDVMPASDLTLYAKWTYSGGGGGGGTGGGGGGSSSGTSALSTKTTATYSEFWVKDANGVWRCFNPKTGDFVRSAWLCDNAVPANGSNVWYLMNTDGTMLAAPLVQDNSGNFYSLETSHYGYFGSLRYKNGVYDGIYMEFSQKHDGTFGAVTNIEAIEALKAKYGITRFNTGNENSVYTANLR